eukprot:463721_1
MIHSGFVTVPHRHHRSRRSRKKRQISEVITIESASSANIPEHQTDSTQQPTKRIWGNHVPTSRSSPHQSIALIQAEQQFETRQRRKLLYESTTNRTFLLSLTLSKLNSDPSLIICASYICRLCQTFNAFMPSSLIILCHQYYQFRRFPTYMRIICSPCNTSPFTCTFINSYKPSNKPFTVKGNHALPHPVMDSCVASNIHLKYPNLIQNLDQDHKFSDWSNIHAMFQCHHNEYNSDNIQTNIILFDEHNPSNSIDDMSAKLNSIIFYDNNNRTVSLQYDVKCGLFMQISNEKEHDCNALYELVIDTKCMWKELYNEYKISTRALTSVLTENIFWCSRDVVCLYNFENKSWSKLQCMGSSWSENAKQLYFDATGQKMFCMGINDSFVKEYAYDDALNRWIDCNTCISFNYYDVVKDNWYRHPSILSNYNGRIESVMWVEESDPNIMYCVVTSCKANEDTNDDSNYHRCRVEYYDNRSNYKQWLYHQEKTRTIQNVILSETDGDAFQIDLVL